MERNMTFISKVKKALIALLSETEVLDDKTVENDYFRSIFAQLGNEDSPTKKLRELEAIIFQLSSKITILVDKVYELDNQVTNLTTLQEELLYTFDQGIEELELQEDNPNMFGLNSKDKKFGFN